jgi:hypothetical protein
MGMGKRSGSIYSQIPIYESMKTQGITEKLMFNICLGKNGGWMQIGGYEQEKLLEKPKWFKLTNPNVPNYRFTLSGVSMNEHFMDGSKLWNVGFIDSGTTYTYVPRMMWKSLMLHFDYFCEQTKNIVDEKGQKKYCTGQRFTTKIEADTYLCFDFNPNQFMYDGGEKDYLMGYPILKFHATDADGNPQVIRWFPSEYLFKQDAEKYCMTVDINGK